MHDLFYVLHLAGMTTLIVSSVLLLRKNDGAVDRKKKISLAMMSAAHLQLLTGFILFFLLLSEVNHMKIGIKMLLAIELAVVATIYNKKLSQNKIPHKFLVPTVLITGVTITVVAFLL